ncbi:MAG: AmmeMemoRadiSam system protein B [Anaerolineaceae bacterium]|nr:AmmeMemoRadiSam system protein B [Anaerolineaceae bacterium]
MKTDVADIRPSAIAGTWYPGNPKHLRDSIKGYLRNAKTTEVNGEVVGLIVPHAGYSYSGAVAVHAFIAITEMQFNNVVVVSPIHQYYRQALLTSAHQAYETPLGNIPINKGIVGEISELIQNRLSFGVSPIANDDEHSLEIELPFLQCVLKTPFSLVPIMIRDQSMAVARALGVALAEVIKETRTLLVASTDLSHFHSEDQANQLDNGVLGEIAAFNPEGLYSLNESGRGQACGLGAVAAIMWASQALGADQASIVNYATSAAITGDTTSVVGYGAAVITRST